MLRADDAKEQSKPCIVVDADACPVKQEIVRTAREFGVRVLMVASFDHRLEEQEGISIVQVDRSDQSADLYIANHIRRDDILVTQDFGLAAVGLGKHAAVLSFRGQQYTNETIDFLLARRHELAKRRRGGMRTKGPKALTQGDKQAFQQVLTKVLKTMQENERL